MDQGLTPYTKALELQNRLMTERIEGTIGDRLILLRHPPTITLGKSARKTDLLLSETRLKGKGFEIVEVGRGGGITYHGPGQVILYPILDLRNHQKDLRWYVHNLEKTMAHSVTELGVDVETREGYPGLWVKNTQTKLGSIGVQVQRWVTMHGLALNVNLTHYRPTYIRPCGLNNVELASLSDYSEVNRNEVRALLLENFSQLFKVQLEEPENEEARVD